MLTVAPRGHKCAGTSRTNGNLNIAAALAGELETGSVLQTVVRAWRLLLPRDQTLVEFPSPGATLENIGLYGGT